jgi:hypothetical protein
MKVGSLVMWLLSTKDYGELGVVVKLVPLHNTIGYRVRWTDGTLLTYEDRDLVDEVLVVLCK